VGVPHEKTVIKTEKKMGAQAGTGQLRPPLEGKGQKIGQKKRRVPKTAEPKNNSKINNKKRGRREIGAEAKEKRGKNSFVLEGNGSKKLKCHPGEKRGISAPYYREVKT